MNEEMLMNRYFSRVFTSASTLRRLAGASFMALIVLSAQPPAWAGNDAPIATMQAANFQVFGNGEVKLPGAAILRRTKRTIDVDIRASNLEPNAAYTAWWVVFNHPKRCATEPCTGADLRNPNVKGANFYATGFITGSDGVANVSASLRVGPLPDGVEAIDFDTGFTPRLRGGRGLKAEIHIVLRYHDQIDTGRVAEQIGTGEFGDCSSCENTHAAIFLPMQ